MFCIEFLHAAMWQYYDVNFVTLLEKIKNVYYRTVLYYQYYVFLTSVSVSQTLDDSVPHTLDESEHTEM